MIAVQLRPVEGGIHNFKVVRTSCSATILTLVFPEGNIRCYPLVNVGWWEQEKIKEEPKPKPEPVEETPAPEPWPPGQILVKGVNDGSLVRDPTEGG